MKTLLLYATKSGAARECAELLAKELTDCTVCDLRHAIPNPELFDTIIVGSGIRFGKIYKPAAKFIQQYKNVLLTKSVSFYFCNCETETFQNAVEKNIPKELLMHADCIKSFGGKMPFKKAQNMNWLKTENKDAFLKAVLPDKEKIKLNFKRLTSAEDAMYPAAMALYAMSFPAHEQREEASQKKILECSQYHFDLIYDGNDFAGVILYWETENFIYVEHFCINPKMRNRRYGQRALELLGKKEKTIILEIDPPSDDISIHRKSFYERCGFKENAFSHVHPPYHKGNTGHELVIMSSPGTLSPEDYESFHSYLNHTVMNGLFPADMP